MIIQAAAINIRSILRAEYLLAFLFNALLVVSALQSKRVVEIDTFTKILKDGHPIHFEQTFIFGALFLIFLVQLFLVLHIDNIVKLI